MAKTLSEEQCAQLLRRKLSELEAGSACTAAGFLGTLVMDLPAHPTVECVDNDPLRERAFMAATADGVGAAVDELERAGVEFGRPIAALDARERTKQTAIPKQLEGVKTKDKVKSKL